jgi:hypothetical protein
MHTRRDLGADWIFPSNRHDGPILSFRKQLERVKEATGIRDVTFQYFVTGVRWRCHAIG